MIKSLLFVNLILQMTSSLRKCFDQDQNLMITIILIAFSLIGLIGLIIGNRFILIIFAACMTLILIASITIYAIGNTEQDPMQPKVPYYTNGPVDSATGGNEAPSKDRRIDSLKGLTKLKSLVGRVLSRVPGKSKANPNRTSTNATLRSSINKRPPTTIAQLQSTKFMAGFVEDTDESSHDALEPTLPVARSGLEEKPESVGASGPELPQIKVPIEEELDPSDPTLARSSQWIAYERHLYERYLNMVSQSVDLVLQTILASWMALLLDEDSDHCFGTRSSERRISSGTPSNQGQVKEDPVYNYNGVRYSIRPDLEADSPNRVVVR